MTAQEKAAGREPGGSENTNDAVIIPLPVRRRNCAACGILFTPRSIRHTLCPICYSWAVHAHHVRLAVAAQRAVR